MPRRTGHRASRAAGVRYVVALCGAASLGLAGCAPAPDATRSVRAPAASVDECVAAYYPWSADARPNRAERRPGQRRAGDDLARAGVGLGIAADLDGREAAALGMLLLAGANSKRFWLQRCLNEVDPSPEDLTASYVALARIGERSPSARRARFGLYSAFDDDQKAAADAALRAVAGTART